MLPALPRAWVPLLGAETTKDYWRKLDEFLAVEQEAGVSILPLPKDIFAAFEATPPAAVRVVLLGQDPYPTPGHAHGLCFSVQPQVRPLPGSLRNIFKELQSDVGVAPSANGNLAGWAEQGVLMLNTVLTVRAGEAGSHQKRGWEVFTDVVIRSLVAQAEPVVFLLWGRHAQAKRGLITASHHAVVEAAHPSPLSARLFLGCRCFSQVNAHLRQAGRGEIDWGRRSSSVLTSDIKSVQGELPGLV